MYSLWEIYKSKITVMGKGDKKSRRGKIILGTYGVRRRRKDAVKDRSTGKTESKPLNESKESSKPEKEVKKVKAPVKPKKEAAEVREPRQVKDTVKTSEPKIPKAKKA